jgi:DNA-binding MarR family transcriptional regulator
MVVKSANRQDSQVVESTENTESTGKSRLKLWIQLLRASRSIETTIRDRLRREFSETLPRFDVMAALYRHPDGMMMSGLSRALMVSNGNVTGIVDRLVKNDLAARSQRDNDRRSWIICLTTSGISHFETMAAAHEGWVDELLQGYSNDEAKALYSELSRLVV